MNDDNLTDDSSAISGTSKSKISEVDHSEISLYKSTLGRLEEITESEDLLEFRKRGKVGSSKKKLTEDLYQGDTEDNLANGIGKMFYVNGNVYEGQWSKGVKKGFGVMNYESGEVYQGEWADDEPHGDGSLTFPNNCMFTGVFASGRRFRGNYTYKYHNNTRFHTEEWDKMDSPRKDRASIQDGYGKYQGEINYSFSGKYHFRCYQIYKHGYGEFHYKNEDIFNGHYKNDKRTGFGIFLEKNGSRYYGNWKADKKSGMGIMLYRDGTYYEGNFSRDKKNGKGRICFPNGDIIQGEFRDDEIGKAEFSKGRFAQIPNPLKEVMMTQILNDSSTIRECRYTSKDKWFAFIDRFANLDEGLDIHSIVLSLQTEASRGKSNPVKKKNIGEPLKPVLDKFLQIFKWQYETKTIYKLHEDLTFAVDDLSSFLICLAETVMIKIGEINPTDHYRDLHQNLMDQLFPPLYSIISYMYSQSNTSKDATLAMRIAEFKDCNPEMLGVIFKKKKKRDFANAVEFLNEIAEETSPLKKMDHLDSFFDTLPSLLQGKKKNQTSYDEEELSPAIMYCVVQSELRNCYSETCMISDFLITEAVSEQARDRVSQFIKTLDKICNLDSNLIVEGKYVPSTFISHSCIKEIEKISLLQDTETISIITSTVLYSAGYGELDITEEELEYLSNQRTIINSVLSHAYLEIEEDLSLAKLSKLPKHIYTTVADEILKLM